LQQFFRRAAGISDQIDLVVVNGPYACSSIQFVTVNLIQNADHHRLPRGNFFRFFTVRVWYNGTFFGYFFRFSKAKGTLLVFLFLRTRAQKLMKEYGVDRERKGFMTTVG
jgi:hypothetical protein